jgi:outer membrane protein TolC
MFAIYPGSSVAHTFSLFAASRGWLVATFGGLLVSLLMGSQSYAQAIPLTLGEAERLALVEEPGHQAYVFEADAFIKKGEAALRLPDPMLGAGIANYPVSGGGFGSEPMTMAQIEIRQNFPRAHSRELRQAMFNGMSVAAFSKAEQRELEVRELVRRAWLDVFYWSRAEEIVLETRPLFEDLLRVSQSMYEVGKKDQKDYLQASLELTRIDDRLLGIRREQQQARARLSQWISTDANRALAGSIPNDRALPSLEQLLANLSLHPEILSADSMIDVDEQAIELAQQDFKPTWGVGMGYGYRSGRMADGSRQSDMVSLQVTVDLPFFGRKRQNNELSAALGERSASTANRAALLRRMEAELRSEYARHSELGDRIQLYESKIVDLANQGAQAALLAYRNDSGDFNDVVRGRVQTLDAELELVQLKVWQGQSYGAIANLGGLRP